MENDKHTFIAYTLLNLFSQLITTLLTSYHYKNKIIRHKWILMFASLGLLFILHLIPNTVSFWIRLLVFFVFSFINGLVLSGITKHIPNTELKEVISQTTLVFICMFIVGYVLQKKRININPFYHGLTTLSFIVSIISIYFVFMDTSIKTRKIFRSILVLCISMYVIYETYNNYSKDYDGDVISSTLDYYLDVYNIFGILTNNDLE